MSNIYALVDKRWSNAGTTYNAIWMDVNNGAGGTAVGAVASNLLLFTNNGIGNPVFQIALSGLITTTNGITMNGGNLINAGGGDIRVQSNSGNFIMGGGQDIVLTRDAAYTLALRSGTNPQAFNIYNTYTDSTDWERFTFQWVGNRVGIGPDNSGSGSARPFDIYIGNSLAFRFGTPSNPNSAIWEILGAGHFVAASDNTYDIGQSGATRPRNLYLAQTANVGVLTWGSVSASINPAEGMMIGCNTAATVAAGATVAASGTGHALLYYDGTQWKVCN